MSLMRYAAIATIVGAAVPLAGQSDKPVASEALLAKMEAAYKTVDALHIKAKSSARYTGAGTPEDFPQPGPDTLELRMQRPNKLFLSAVTTQDGERSSYLVVCDGTTLSYWKSWTNSFGQTKAPAVLAGMARQLPGNLIGFGTAIGWEVQDIFEWDALTDDQPSSTVKEFEALGGKLATTGPEKQDGAVVYVVRQTVPRSDVLPFTTETRYHLDAESYLVRGLGISLRGKHPDNGRDFTVEIKIQYELFSTRPTFSDADFRFVVPPGARPDKGR